MAAEIEPMETATATASSFSGGGGGGGNKRKLMQRGKGRKKPNKKKKKLKPVEKPKKPTQKMIKLYKKRAKAYNSDDDDDDNEEIEEEEEEEEEKAEDEPMDEASTDDDDDDRLDDEFPSSDNEEDEDGENRRSITKFAEGCRAFGTAFLKIMKKHITNDPLGPILSAHKKLVAEKLLEEEIEHKAKGEAKKEKHLAGEKGHVKPANYLDTKEKLLISIATKGVVKLFNAVNKAQNPQKGLNPSKPKDAKELSKRRKQTFLSELKKSTKEAPDNSSLFNFSKVSKSKNKETEDEPQWAPLRDSYMLTNSKLKDWNKMPDPAAVVDQGTGTLESSSDED